MSQDATVNAGDIARLVDVGRAAVSNWRRRYGDFPQPVGGTASSPLFSLHEVEEWLRRNGKTYEVSLADRTWQRLRTAGDDLRLGALVAAAGALLLTVDRKRRSAGGKGASGPRSSADERNGARVPAGRATAATAGSRPSRPAGAGTGVEPARGLPAEPEVLDRDLADLIIELGGELGPADAFEFLCARYQEAHSRRLCTTPPDTAALLLDLVGRPDTVLDPACGLGTLLVGGTVLGQELNATSATIAAVRLLLAGRDATVVAGDSLRADGLAGRLADAVVCDPPFNERAWGYQDLTSDPRWEYGLPPRGESELAWVQHCLAHTRPGGMAAVLMPPAAAARRPGKRIRGNLLRAGALRAVISLAAGGPDLWLLRRPEPGDRPPSHVLLTSDEDVRTAWHRFLDDPTTATRIIDVLDDDVDVSPARHRPAHHGEELVRELAAVTRTLRELDLRPPEFATPGEPRPTTSVGELAKAGLLTVQHAPARMTTDDGDVPVLTADDLAANRPPSGRTTADDGLVEIAEGDVVASVLGAARVMTTGGAVLGPYLSRYRVDPERLDPDFLAGVLRAAQPTHPGSSRTDARRTQVPRLSLAEQRAYGAAFRQLGRLEDTLRTATAAGETLVRLGFDGLVAGHLRPAD